MLADALKLARQFHRLSQAEMADKIGISKSYLSEIENDKKTPSLEILESYAKAFSVPTSSLLMFSESIETKNSTFSPAKKALRIMRWIAEDCEIDQGEKEARG